MTIIPDRDLEQAVFGPVPSRRLGMSLGVDLLMPKTCSLDCLYCELGRTTQHTLERREYRETDLVLEQVERRLKELDQPPDFITLAGSGEPTLHSRMGQVIAGLKEMSPARVAVLTNSTLTPDPQVRDELRLADVLVPSLDAVSQEIFEKLNRPVPGLLISDIIGGLIRLREQFKGELWLEILLARGFNDSPEEIKALAAAAQRINPQLVQLNTVVRPPAAPGVKPLSAERLDQIAGLFDLEVQVTGPAGAHTSGDRGSLADQVVEMTRRRPCTVQDVAAMTGLDEAEAGGLIEDLRRQGRMLEEPFDGKRYFRGV